MLLKPGELAVPEIIQKTLILWNYPRLRNDFSLSGYIIGFLKQARSSKTGKVVNKKSAAGKPISSIPAEPVPPADDEVLRYIERQSHGRYRFRYWIPRRLQELIDQREVRRTLGTKDREEAIKAARPIFMELRERRYCVTKEPTAQLKSGCYAPHSMRPFFGNQTGRIHSPLSFVHITTSKCLLV